MHRLWPMLDAELSLKPERKSSNVQVKLYREILQVKKLTYMDITQVLGLQPILRKQEDFISEHAPPPPPHKYINTSFPSRKKTNRICRILFRP